MKSKTGSSVSDDDDHVKSAEGSREIVISLRIKNVPEDCDHDNKEVDDRRKSPQSITIVDDFFAKYFRANPEFFQQAFQFVLCCIGLQVTYNLWGQMQERIMTTRFEPTPNVPSGQFPSAAFCVCFNLLVAVLVGMIAVCIRQHGAVLDNNNNNNKVPFYYFKPCATSNLVAYHSQYAALQYVSFQTQTIVKCSKLVPVMMWGTALVGAQFQFLSTWKLCSSLLG